MATAKEIALWAKTRRDTLLIDARRQRELVVSLATDEDGAATAARAAFIEALEACASLMNDCADRIEHG